MIVLDSFLPNFYEDKIKEIFLNLNFLWYFLDYVDDSYGVTLNLNKKYNGEFQEDICLYNILILKRISPKKDRLVTMLDSYYHTVEQFKINKRCTINCNLE